MSLIKVKVASEPNLTDQAGQKVFLYNNCVLLRAIKYITIVILSN